MTTSHNITDHNPTRAKLPLDQRHTSKTTTIGNYKTSVQENRRQQLLQIATSLSFNEIIPARKRARRSKVLTKE